MKQIDVREGARRQHRMLGIFCVLQCWQRGIDGVKIDRDQLKRLLGLEKFKVSRCQWLLADLTEYFNFCEVYPKIERVSRAHNVIGFTFTHQQDIMHGSLEYITLSRINPDDNPRIEDFLIWEKITSKGSEVLEAFAPFMAESSNYDERLLSSYLALLCQGQISPDQLPNLKK